MLCFDALSNGSIHSMILTARIQGFESFNKFLNMNTQETGGLLQSTDLVANVVYSGVLPI